jgi:alcohol dehydrogenase (cytochrome c)
MDELIRLETMEARFAPVDLAADLSGLPTTAGGLLFSSDVDRYFAAHDLDTGEKIWESRLGTGGSSTTVTYAVDGRQYIAVVTSNNGIGNPGNAIHPDIDSATGPGGNMIWVFALPTTR